MRQTSLYVKIVRNTVSCRGKGKKKPPPAIAKGREKPAVPPCFSPDGAALLLARIAARGIRFNAGGAHCLAAFRRKLPY